MMSDMGAVSAWLPVLIDLLRKMLAAGGQPLTPEQEAALEIQRKEASAEFDAAVKRFEERHCTETPQ